MTITRDPALWNQDLAPVPASGRSWGMWHIAALWIGLAVGIPTYTLAAGLNWRALVAAAAGIAVNLPGFLAQASGGAIAVPAFFAELSTYAWFASLLIAAVAYLALSLIWPAGRTSTGA